MQIIARQITLSKEATSNIRLEFVKKNHAKRCIGYHCLQEPYQILKVSSSYFGKKSKELTLIFGAIIKSSKK